MGRLSKIMAVLIGLGLAAGCSDSLEEMPRDEARATVRKIAAEAFRQQFGELPAPLSESETGCDSAQTNDLPDAYVAHGVWESPLAAEDHERIMIELRNGSSRFKSMLTPLGDGRFALDGYDTETGFDFSVTSGEPPSAVRLTVSSPCLLASD